MFAIPLGTDAELRPLEPWHAEEFLNNVDRGREFIGRFIGMADRATDLASARAFLQSYADKTAADAGRIYGIWADGVLVGGVLFRTMDVEEATAEAGCWLGMSRDGVLRESAVHRGARYDLEIWSVLAPEWRSRQVS